MSEAISSTSLHAGNLPLYDLLAARLNQRIQTQPFSVDLEYLSHVSAVLNSLKPDQAQQVALFLIHHYFLSSPGGNPFVTKPNTRGSGGRSGLPYEIIMSPEKGFSFELASVPVGLQALIGTHCSL